MPQGGKHGCRILAADCASPPPRRRLAGPAGPTDGELLARYARGDAAAFAALMARHGGLVLAACRRAAGDAHLAEDCFQANFLALARQAAAFSFKSASAALRSATGVRRSLPLARYLR